MHNEQAEGRGRRTAFLAALQEGRSVTGAAVAAGVNRTLLYKWRGEMAEFAAAWDEAVRTAADLIEDEALRRAMHGVQRPVFWRGEQIGSVTTYSDRLLALLLQRRRPVSPPARAKARDQAMEPDLAVRLVAARQRVARSLQEQEAKARGTGGAADTVPAVAPPQGDAPAALPAAGPPGNDGGAFSENPRILSPTVSPRNEGDAAASQKVPPVPGGGRQTAAQRLRWPTSILPSSAQAGAEIAPTVQAFDRLFSGHDQGAPG